VAVFGDTAEHLAGSLKKGDRVYVEGRLKLNAPPAAKARRSRLIRA